MTVSLETAGVLHLSAAVLLAAGVVISWLPTTRQRWVALSVFVAGTMTLTAEGWVRTMITGRPPVVGSYENTLVVAAMIALACVLILLWAPSPVRLNLTRLTSPWALAALAFGALFGAAPLVIGVEGRGLLAYGHAFVGWLDFTVLLVGTMAAVGMLVHRREGVGAWQAVMTRMLGAGFALLTATMATGALLSFGVFGSWYQWQIVETLSAVLWLAYGVALHAFLLFGWRDKRLAVLTVTLLPVVLATFWVWAVYPATYHFFERVLGS